MTHYLIVDAHGTSAEEVERVTGCKTHDTQLGILIEGRKPFDLQGVLAEIDRALHPSRCICGKFVAIHQPNCPMAFGVT